MFIPKYSAPVEKVRTTSSQNAVADGLQGRQEVSTRLDNSTGQSDKEQAMLLEQWNPVIGLQPENRNQEGAGGNLDQG